MVRRSFLVLALMALAPNPAAVAQIATQASITPHSPAIIASGRIAIDGDFPGGNIVVDALEGDRVSLHQNLRDLGAGNWFYWNFRVRGGGGRTVRFVFTHPWGPDRKALNVMGVRGPAISLDGGETWRWLGAGAVSGNGFSYRFAPGQDDVRFSSGMPYVGAQFDAFMRAYRAHPNLEAGTLALTREGRRVERLHLGNLSGQAKYRVVIAARHHASEMMGSYVLEGLIGYLLDDPANGGWFRANAEALIVPFVDKDGVENGDQG